MGLRRKRAIVPLRDRAIKPQWLALQSFVLEIGAFMIQDRAFPIDGGARRRFRSVGDRSPTCGTEVLNLVLDVLAQPARHSHIRRSLYSAKEKGFVSLRIFKDL